MRQIQEKLTAFPAFFKVAGRKVAIFGSGAEATAKARLLANSSALITLYAENPDIELRGTVQTHDLALIEASFREDQLDDAVMAYAATGNPEEDRRIVAAARAKKIPVNAVDQPDYCDFFTPALVNRAPVAVAIGTEGAGPVLAQMIRARIDRLLPPSLGRLAQFAAEYRDVVERLVPRGASRRTFWRKFFDADVASHIAADDEPAARMSATTLLEERQTSTGHVWLVGAGPGAQDLMTIRAQRVLMEADAIVFDALVPHSLVDMGRRDAERYSVGKRKGCHSKNQKEIDALLVALARAGKRVVRLKSGDPLIFGRAGEELAALRTAGVSHEVVPGVTSAFATAADFGLPLTLRGVASTLVFTTGHDLTGKILPDWVHLALSGATVAIYMGRSVAASVAEKLWQAGLSAETTIAVAENAGRVEKRLFHGTLADLPLIEAANELEGPVMVIIGEAVAGADLSRSIPISNAFAAAAGVAA